MPPRIRTQSRSALRDAVVNLPEATEVEALKKALLSQSIDADYVLDVHCDSEALLHLYGLVEHEDDLSALGAALGADVVLLEKDAGGDPFDTANSAPWVRLAGKLPNAAIAPACFAVTVELRGHADVDDDLGAKDAAGILAFLRQKGVVAGDDGTRETPRCQPTPLEGVDIVHAPGAGLLAYKVTLGDRVRKGDVIAELIDLMADDPNAARTPITAGTDGLVFTRVEDRLVRPGQSVVKIAGAVALENRKQGQLLEN